jgi:hypothetical protein
VLEIFFKKSNYLKKSQECFLENCEGHLSPFSGMGEQKPLATQRGNPLRGSSSSSSLLPGLQDSALWCELNPITSPSHTLPGTKSIPSHGPMEKQIKRNTEGYSPSPLTQENNKETHNPHLLFF